MDWKTKAAIQNLMGKLPPGLGNPVYYRLQRTFGGLRHPDPLSRLRAGVELVQRLQKLERSVEAAVFLEVGTGHQLNLPLSLWLCGAAQVITVDLNPYLQERLVADDLVYLGRHGAEVRDLFAGIPNRAVFEERFARLVTGGTSLREVLRLTNIRYLAPADASRLDLDSHSIDYHISFTVLEHIPVMVLKGIFQEGRRLLRPQGLFVHCIDFTDHFAHSDASVSSVNFLQFSESEWESLAGNRYMFHNRLRVDEFEGLLAGLDLEILALEVRVDESALELLSRGFPLAERFQTKSCRVNAAAGAWLVASPASGVSPRISGVSPPPLRVISPCS